MSVQVTPLRQRMIDDMAIRNMSPLTQKAYVRAVKNFSLHFRRSPDEARRHPEPLNFMPPVAVKRCAPAPIRSHCPSLRRKRQPSRRAERQNPHSGGPRGAPRFRARWFL